MRLKDVSLTLFLIALCSALAFTVGASEGRKAAYGAAYNTNPPSQELEMVCLGLWVGEQNKKYWAKEQAK